MCLWAVHSIDALPVNVLPLNGVILAKSVWQKLSFPRDWSRIRSVIVSEHIYELLFLLLRVSEWTGHSQLACRRSDSICAHFRLALGRLQVIGLVFCLYRKNFI